MINNQIYIIIERPFIIKDIKYSHLLAFYTIFRCFLPKTCLEYLNTYILLMFFIFSRQI